MYYRLKWVNISIIFCFLSITIYSQGWNSVQQINIPSSLFSEIDLCTNKNGNNVLITYSNYPTDYFTYYLFNTSGAVIRSHQFETQYVEFANIDGNDDKIYVVYKLGNVIKTWKSTNAGQNWIPICDISIGSNTCNNVDIVWGKDDNILHLVWATQDDGNNFKTYYAKLVNDVWSASENVTDVSYAGGFPTISKSNNRVHVSYNTGQYADPTVNLGEAWSRDKLNSTWQTLQLVYQPTSFRERIHAGSSKLFDFYYKFESGMGNYHADLYVKNRAFNSTIWSSPVLLHQGADVNEIVSSTNTNDNSTHIVYSISGGTGYRIYSNGNWSDESYVLDYFISPRIYSVSNDLYVVAGGSNYLYFRQYDAAPSAPVNLLLSSYNNHPKLTWTKNPEADIDYYRIYKKIGRDSYSIYATSSANEYIDYDEIVCPSGTHCANEDIAHYEVTAIDLTSHESDNSNEVEAVIIGDPPQKMKSSASTFGFEYLLQQNYPNPFNPTTSISYQVKKKGLVSLKVYDMLGREVANLVNETQEAGEYSATFNTFNLPSGIYIYSLKVNDFVQNNKMILMK